MSSSPDQDAPNRELRNHPLFSIPDNTHRWYSQHTYEAKEEEALRLVKSFERIRADYEAALPADAELFQRYIQIARILWRTYHLAEARPLLETIARLDPDHAETQFYLGQLYQDDPECALPAIRCYKRFVQLQPRLTPENNYFIDGWFIWSHGYKPSTIEALTSIAVIFQERYQHYDQAIQYYQKAISTSPSHHLAPYVRLADLLKERRHKLAEVLRLYKKAEENYLKTNWDGYPYDRPCDYYSKLEEWASERYPFTYRYYEVGLERFMSRYEKLLEVCYERQDYDVAGECIEYIGQLLEKQLEDKPSGLRAEEKVKRLERYGELVGGYYDRTGDYKRALVCFGTLRRLLRKANIQQKTHLCARQIELVFVHSRDYWQVESPCLEILKEDPNHRTAQEYLGMAREKLGRR